MADFPGPDRERVAVPHDGMRRGELYSFRTLTGAVRRRWIVFVALLGGLLALCVLYCLVAPNQYEASAKVALRMQAASSLSVDGAESMAPASILSTPLQLETLVNVIRSERLAWRVIGEERLYQSEMFNRTFVQRFGSFEPGKATAEQRSILLDTFEKRLTVRSLPRTFLIEIRFRSKDPALAMRVVNAVIRDYLAIESETRVEATEQSSSWLHGQLVALTTDVEAKERRMAAFERAHGFTTTQQMVQGGQPVETLHDPTAMQIDEAGRLLATASGDRILREALYREAQAGNPELVLAANPELRAELGPGGAMLLQQLRTKASDLGVELAELKAEHGAKFPRVLELERARAEVDLQIAAEDANLLEAFRRTWAAAGDREVLLRTQLASRMEEGMRQNDATIQYAVLHEEVQSGRELCSRLKRRMQEAGLSVGVHASSILVVDWAREPFKPVAPDVPVYMAIALFAGLWVALAAVLGLERWRPLKMAAIALLMLSVASADGWSQAPTPNTQGLPSGVVKIPLDAAPARTPNAKDSPVIWNSLATAPPQSDTGVRPAGSAMAMPVGVGDSLDVSEFHTPEFRSTVRVAADGTVVLPMLGQIRLLGLSEQEASRAIEKAFVDGELLLHPQVSVLVTNAVGQDVSVMGEVARPGVYPYTVHHRLLDVISVASGLTTNAGQLVSVFHREDAKTAHPYVLDPTGTGGMDGGKTEHNPELLPGDTVLVSRAGLVYVIGDVVRPGGFAVDPVQGLTVVQALSLAWGATTNASVSKAILIRDQAGGRTLTTLNLRKMIRGEDPDQPVRDRDILFVPDSATKALLNKTLESAIQSAIGVSIYAGLVYSQRF